MARRTPEPMGHLCGVLATVRSEYEPWHDEPFEGRLPTHKLALGWGLRLIAASAGRPSPMDKN